MENTLIYHCMMSLNVAYKENTQHCEKFSSYTGPGEFILKQGKGMLRKH